MICPECKSEGKRSTVRWDSERIREKIRKENEEFWIGSSDQNKIPEREQRYSWNLDVYWDEDGVYHYQKVNTIGYYVCSNGHHFTTGDDKIVWCVSE